jgi:hypothetical protein
VRQIELALRGSFRAPVQDVPAIGSEFHDPVIAISIADENRAVASDGNATRHVEMRGIVAGSAAHAECTQHLAFV